MSQPGRFLITSWDGGGNTPSAINLGARLREAGHAVRLLGWESMASRVRPSGIEFRTYPSMAPWPAGLSLDEGWDRMAAELWGEATRDDILSEAADFAPDVLVLDCMLLAGFDAARKLGCRTAVLMHVLYAPFVHEWGDDVMKVGLGDLLATTDQVLALTPPGFDTDTALPANTSYVGPIGRLHGAPSVLTEEDRSALSAPGDPWILLSLSSTLQGQRQALPALLEAVATLPVRCLLTLGDVLPAESVHAPPNVMVRGYLPHEDVMPSMSAVIGHGGLSTITMALSYGLPMVCVPQGREQPINAARLQAVGAGLAVAQDSPAEDIGVAVMTVLADPAFRGAARGFARASAQLAYGGAAVSLVEELLGQPATPPREARR